MFGGLVSSARRRAPTPDPNRFACACPTALETIAPTVGSIASPPPPSPPKIMLVVTAEPAPAVVAGDSEFLLTPVLLEAGGVLLLRKP